MRKTLGVTLFLLFLTIAAGCDRGHGTPEVEAVALRPMVGAFADVASPSGPGAGQPHVAVETDGSFLMSWTEPDGALQALKVSRFEHDSWATPRVISARDDFFVNWADFPSVTPSGDAIYAHWLQRSAPGTYNYDVMVSISRDHGATWGDPFVVHDDGVKAEHGFASMRSLPDSRAGIVWLDGREMPSGHDDGHGDMAIRYAELSPDGSMSSEAVLDTRTCECCTTTITSTPTGTLVAWRDRSDDEIRDISFSRLVDGSWTAPESLHSDGWRIEGCPVNGPQADSLGDSVAVAWFTAADEKAEVNVSFSRDGGVSFARPSTLAGGEGVVGYVDVILVSEDRAFVTWMVDMNERIDLVGREATSSGVLTEPVVLASTSRGRTGFPRMARSGDEILLAWNEKGDSPKVRVARAMISR